MSIFKSYLDQDYEKIKQQLLNSGKLFEDKFFPRNNKSLFRFKEVSNVVWKRPHEISDNPQFIVGEIVPNDIDQGQLGDCWLISSCAAVATVPEYINIVIPKEGQSFETSEYAGIFHFRLWRFGEWVDVVVDDYLPVDSESNNLIYCHNNKDSNEMFGPLLEKAFAKMNICYEFLEGGDAVDAMIDMTSGISESFRVRTKGNNPIVDRTTLWNILFKSFFMKSLCGTSIDVGSGKQEDIKKNGLVVGHAYGVENAVEIYSQNGGSYDSLRSSYKEPSREDSLKLLRIRNPWGQDDSWHGKWSSESKSWDDVTDELKANLKYNESEGKFYISYDDFCKNFDDVQFVHVNMNAFYDSTEPNNLEFNWKLNQIIGEWIPGKNSGGCGNEDYDAYWTNPQYCFSLSPENDSDDKISIVVSLLQTEQAQKRLETDGSYQNSNEAIYFSIYKIINPKDDNKLSNKKYLDRDLREVANSDTYFYQREVSKRFELPADEYVIIPSLFKMNVKMKFVLRMYIETSLADVKITELNKNFKKKPQIQEIIYSDPKPIPKESEVNDSGTGPVSNESEIIEPGPALASEENKIDQSFEDENEYYIYEDEINNSDYVDPRSYHSRNFEIPKFDVDMISSNISRACSIM